MKQSSYNNYFAFDEKQNCFLKKKTQNLQEPINNKYQGDVINWQPDRCENYNHGNQTGLRNACRTNRSRRCRYTESKDWKIYCK